MTQNTVKYYMMTHNTTTHNTKTLHDGTLLLDTTR